MTPYNEMTLKERLARRAELASDRRQIPNASVVIGVDVLGRVLAGIDDDRDGIADLFLKFTWNARIPQTWELRMDRARATLTRGTAMIEATDKSAVVILAIEGAETPAPNDTKYAKTYEYVDGHEFIRTTGEPGAQVSLATLDFNNLQTWPANFATDLLLQMQGTFPPGCNCLDYNCDLGGGCGATNCSYDAPQDQGACSTTCGANAFACCRRANLGGSYFPVCNCVAYSPQCFQ